MKVPSRYNVLTLTVYRIQILGLSDCADTIVGDELHRGISGGQKKRTTIGKHWQHTLFSGRKELQI
jgi:hypothetical protein